VKVLYKVGLTSQITKNLPFGAIEDIQHCRGKNIALGASAADNVCRLSGSGLCKRKRRKPLLSAVLKDYPINHAAVWLRFE